VGQSYLEDNGVGTWPANQMHQVYTGGTDLVIPVPAKPEHQKLAFLREKGA
jgi:hypothetical protein